MKRFDDPYKYMMRLQGNEVSYMMVMVVAISRKLRNMMIITWRYYIIASFFPCGRAEGIFLKFCVASD